MLNFLQKLRRNNMQKSTYLKYAIGEIILVVLGILIALTINNWNEQRKENKNEKILLEKVQVEHQYNLDPLYSDTSYINSLSEAISDVYFNLKEIGPDSDSIVSEKVNTVLRVSL